jgi:hypothetical protein
MITLNNPKENVLDSLYACRIEIKTTLNGLVSGLMFTPEQRRLLQTLLQDMQRVERLLEDVTEEVSK